MPGRARCGMTATGADGCRPLRRQPRPPGRGRPAAHRARAPSSTTSRCRGCCTPASCAARSPGPRSARIDTSAALALPGVRVRVHRRRPQPRRQGAVAHLDRPAEPRDAAARRWPRARCASSATRSRWSWPTTATSPRTRPSWSTSTTSRCPPVVDYRDGRATPTDLVHESPRLERRSAPSTACPPSALDEVFASAAHVVSETIYQQAYAAVPMEARGLVVDYSRRRGELTIYSATQAPHEVRAVLLPPAGHARAPHPGDHARHRRRVRPEGPGAARRDVPDAGRPQGAARR